MKSKEKLKFFSLILCMTLALIFISFPAYAGKIDMPASDTEEISHPDGHMEMEEDIICESIYDHLPADYISYDMDEPLPSRYNPLDYPEDDPRNYLPPTRDQGMYGTCWAYAVIATAEIDLIKNKRADKNTLDLSELQLVYFTYFTPSADPLGLATGDYNSKIGDKDFLHGGNAVYALRVMSGWITANPDQDELAYSNAPNVLSRVEAGQPGLDESLAFSNRYHLRNYYRTFIKTYPNEAKHLIKDYGAVAISYYNDESYLASDKISYYCHETKSTTTHAVTVVGWDDDYPAEKFNTRPAGNGAWLIRNSWIDGAAAGYDYDTYFWMSYYDKGIGSMACTGVFEEETEYDCNYRYDGAVCTKDYYNFDNDTRIANVYTAQKETERLKAVGFETMGTNINHEICIYKNLTDGTDPESGTLVHSQTYFTTYQGYYTVPLDKEVPLTEGDQFSVVIKLNRPDNTNVPVARERTYANDWLKTVATAKTGESFYKQPSDPAWTDVSTLNDGDGNIIIRAYTKDASDILTGITFSQTEQKLKMGGTFTLQPAATPQAAKYAGIIWSSSNESVVTVENGLVTARGIGTAVITATVSDNTAIEASCTVTVVPEISITAGKYIGTDIDTESSGVILGAPFEVSINVTPEGGLTDNTDIIWSSSNDSIVSVSGRGITAKATPRANGTAIVRAACANDSDINATLQITVNRLKNPEADYTIDNSIVGKVTFSWEAVEGAALYKLFIYEDGKKDETLKEYETTKTSYTAKDLTAGRKYFYYVHAYNAKKTMDSTAATNPVMFRIKKIFNIVYELNGGNNSDTNPDGVEEEATVNLKNPSRKGYKSDGWYDNAEFSGDAVESLKDVTGDMTVYAKWTPINYRIIFNGNGADTGSVPGLDMVYDTEKALPENAFTRDYFTFNGWNTKADGSGISIKDGEKVKNLHDSDGSIVELYAVWNPIPYKINYILCGGQNDAENPAEYTVESPYLTLKAPQRYGYSFEGWYEDSKYKTPFPENFLTSTAKEVTVYAKWSVDEAESWGDVPESFQKVIKTPQDAPRGIWTVSPANIYYTGKAIKFADKLNVYYGKKLLKQGTDYTVSYKNNKKVYIHSKNSSLFDSSKAPTCIITGKGGFKGSYKLYFVIKPADNAAGDASAYNIKKDAEGKIKIYKSINKENNEALTVTDVISERDRVEFDASDISYVYEKGGVKPGISIYAGDKLLNEGVDYTLQYKNNNAIYTYKQGDSGFKASKAPTITITGKGYYTGTVKKYFTITKSSLENTSIIAADVVYKNKGNIIGSTVKIFDKNGKELKAGTDYEKISYKYEEDTVIGKVTREKGTAVKKTDILPVGCVVRATIKGKGKYAGNSDTQSITFKIVTDSIAKANVRIPEYYYTGNAIVPDLTGGVSIDGRTLTAKEIKIVSCTGNVNTGKATLTFMSEAFGGYKTVKFTIKKRNFTRPF